MKKMLKTAAIILLALAAALGCKEEPRWLRIYHDGEFKWEIDVSGWEVGEDVVPLGVFYYPWQGEDSIDFIDDGGYLYVNGSRVGADAWSLDLDTIPNPEEIITLKGVHEDFKVLSRFSNLAGLCISLNDETPSIPLGELTQLRCLEKSGRAFTRQELEDIATLSELRDLRVDFSEFRDLDLLYVQRLTNLRSLDVSFTGITDDGLTYVAGLTELRRLDLGGNDISDKGVAQLGGLSHLEELRFFGAPITDLTLELIGDSFPDIKILDLRTSYITDSGLRHLENLNNLRTIWFSEEGITDKGVGYLSRIKSLEELLLSGNGITDIGLLYLKELPNLRILMLSGIDITDEGLLHLGVHTGLEELSLTNSSLTDYGMTYLANLRNLRKLRLSGTDITDASIPVLAGFRRLQELDVVFTSISDTGAAELRGLLPDCEVISKTDIIRINPNPSLSTKEILQMAPTDINTIEDND